MYIKLMFSVKKENEVWQSRVNKTVLLEYEIRKKHFHSYQTSEFFEFTELLVGA